MFLCLLNLLRLPVLLILKGKLLRCRYYTDPSGTFWQCNAKAIGSGSEGADSSLQEQFNQVCASSGALKHHTCYLPFFPS